MRKNTCTTHHVADCLNSALLCPSFSDAQTFPPPPAPLALRYFFNLSLIYTFPSPRHTGDLVGKFCLFSAPCLPSSELSSDLSGMADRIPQIGVSPVFVLRYVRHSFLPLLIFPLAKVSAPRPESGDCRRGKRVVMVSHSSINGSTFTSQEKERVSERPDQDLCQGDPETENAGPLFVVVTSMNIVQDHFL